MIYDVWLQALNALDQFHQIGQQRINLKFLDIYPSDAILETRLGPEIWEMFTSSESHYSSLSSAKSAQKEQEIKVENDQKAAEIRKLNAAAKEFKPKSTAALSVGGSSNADIIRSLDNHSLPADPPETAEQVRFFSKALAGS